MKRLVFLILLFCVCGAVSNAQQRPARIAVFAPLYLDSVFTGTSFKYGKNFPRFTQQGFDFMQGVRIAADSLAATGARFDLRFFDSKSYTEPVSTLIRSGKLDSMEMLIGSIKDIEFTQLAAFAKEKNIPFVSATFPNDGNVTNNPFLIIANSTWRAHCEALFAYLLQTNSTDNILLVSTKGSSEQRIVNYFDALNTTEKKPLLNIRKVTVDGDFNVVYNALDSTKANVVIGAGLTEEFATAVATSVYPFKKKQSVTVIAMPNWDGFKELKKSSFKDLPFIYTTAYINPPANPFSTLIRDRWLKNYKGAPSDMSFKGFEAMYHFGSIFMQSPDDFMNRLNETQPRVFTTFNFKPVYFGKQKGMPDYFENKHLYFMRMVNGTAGMLY